MLLQFCSSSCFTIAEKEKKKLAPQSFASSPVICSPCLASPLVAEY